MNSLTNLYNLITSTDWLTLPLAYMSSVLTYIEWRISHFELQIKRNAGPNKRFSPLSPEYELLQLIGSVAWHAVREGAAHLHLEKGHIHLKTLAIQINELIHLYNGMLRMHKHQCLKPDHSVLQPCWALGQTPMFSIRLLFIISNANQCRLHTPCLKSTHTPSKMTVAYTMKHNCNTASNAFQRQHDHVAAGI
jgi:hypothetical protein